MRACARQALRVGSPSEAAGILKRALQCSLDSQARLSLLREYVDVLERGALWNEIVPALEELIGLETGSSSDAVHTERELSLIDAQRRCGTGPEPLLEKLLRCVSSKASAQHRVRAATIALKICDNICRSDVAQHVFQEVEPLLDDEAVCAAARFECDLIFQSCAGDASRAAAAARQWIAVARRDGSELEVARVLLYASLGLSMNGDLDEAYGAALESFGMASQRGVMQIAAVAADLLSGIALLGDDLEDAGRWADEAVQYGRRAAVAYGTPGCLQQAAYVAICRGEYDRAAELAAESDAHSALFSYRRAATWSKAFALILGLERGGRVPAEPEIDDFLAAFRAVQRFVMVDFLAHVAYRLLFAAGRQTEAATLVREFAQCHRRDRSPLLPLLRRDIVESENSLLLA
jgi:hypothetical protein